MSISEHHINDSSENSDDNYYEICVLIHCVCWYLLGRETGFPRQCCHNSLYA
jgi:hypothetical protein